MGSQFVGTLTAPDGASPFTADRVSRDGAFVETQAHGSYYEQASRSRVFQGSSASTGIALLLPATTGNHPTLWNPYGSGRNLSILRLELSYVSGNNAPGAVEWAVTKNTGSTIGTAAPIVTFTRGTIEPAMVGGTADTVAAWAPAVCTFTAAPVFLRAAGISLFTGISTTAVAPFTLRADYSGDFVLGPGSAASLCFQTTTTTALFQVTVAWEEVPV